PELTGPMVSFIQSNGTWKNLPACAELGLTAKGEALLNELMHRGALIDIDHMSARASRKALDLMKARGYPAISGHSSPTASRIGEQRREGNLSATERADLLAGGGALALITMQGHDGQMGVEPSLGYPNLCNASSETFAQPLAHLIANGVRAIAFGTDFNGGIAQPHGRSCASQAPRVKYPFTAVSGSVLDKQVL